MRIGLISPTSMFFMPYLDNYRKVLDEIGANYDIVNWDRFNNEKVRALTYRDNKYGHKRNIYDYYKYIRFVKQVLSKNKYDRLIIFAPQLACLMYRILVKEYKEKFILDIRDRNSIIRFFNMDKLISRSFNTVLSSAGYQKWLPKSDKYIINHNTTIDSMDKLNPISFKEDKYNPVIFNEVKAINIYTIGAIRDLEINKKLIEGLKDSKRLNLRFCGEGVDSKELIRFSEENKVLNATFTGRYSRDEEVGLYESADLISVLRYNDSLNNMTALPNRLYLAPQIGKPLLAYEGSFLADIIAEYSLGLIIKDFQEVEAKICDYMINFDMNEYSKYRIDFFDMVIKDNKLFRKMIMDFVSK